MVRLTHIRLFSAIEIYILGIDSVTTPTVDNQACQGGEQLLRSYLEYYKFKILNPNGCRSIYKTSKILALEKNDEWANYRVSQ